MKVRQSLLLFFLLLTTMCLSAFESKIRHTNELHHVKIAAKGYKGIYGYAFVRGSESNKAMFSQIIYEPPYSECKESRDHLFWLNVEKSFGKYLRANTDEKFDLGKVEHSCASYGSDFLTRQKAQDDMYETIAYEKKAGHQVTMISFSYTCQQ
ncbi:hypothetical protein BDD43_3255 [Mucilaginibacter gracilis]|uniref:Uncharacterized protein n=1 Tax=Mucilaginibacter gracilis TaxID=423350 RepID=A0A495J259_9SPHI|nr:hypothetical protein [Mucilaginibacter gracilis]RKR83055.1 hypothetical protein BDD43_3255 [Mucilaginibacter gracilis]